MNACGGSSRTYFYAQQKMEASGQLHSLTALSRERTPVPVEEEAECT